MGAPATEAHRPTNERVAVWEQAVQLVRATPIDELYETACDRGACRGLDPDWFAVAPPDPVAVATCTACEVRAECCAYAIGAREQWGMWGGITAHLRTRLGRVASARPTYTDLEILSVLKDGPVARHAIAAKAGVHHGHVTAALGWAKQAGVTFTVRRGRNSYSANGLTPDGMELVEVHDAAKRRATIDAV